MKKQKGITLIALIITIIVMLILVGVSVTVALNGGLFNTAKQATDKTGLEKDKEVALSEGEIEIGGLVYASIEDYKNGNPKTPEGWTVATATERATAWPAEGTNINQNVIAMKEPTTNKIIPLPKGYQISLKGGENTVAEGLVITDGVNEFVWIPVAADKVFSDTYIYPYAPEGMEYSEPVDLSWDSNDVLKHYYGENYYTMTKNFDYDTHFIEMKTSVEKYDGFYMGRYETTIDGTTIGTKKSTPVLTVDAKLKEGTFLIYEGDSNSTTYYYYRWWGLYDAQRKSNVKGNGSTVQTSMVWGQQWEAMIAFLGEDTTKYSVDTLGTLDTAGKQKAGEAKYKYTPSGETESIINDEICNIYDLRGNVTEYSAMGYNLAGIRASLGGDYNSIKSPKDNIGGFMPTFEFGIDARVGTRMTLYIK